MKVHVLCFLMSTSIGATADSDGCCTGTFLTDPQDCPNSNEFLRGQRCCPGLDEWMGERIKCWNPPTPAPTLHCTSPSCMKKCQAASDCGKDENCTVVYSVEGPWGGPRSVCMGHNISNGRFCLSDDDCASKKCQLEVGYGDMAGTCLDPPTTSTTSTTTRCASSACMKLCQAASDCGKDESCTIVLGGHMGHSVCKGHDALDGHLWLAGLGGACVATLGLVVVSAALCLRWRPSNARDHLLMRSFSEVSVAEATDVTTRTQIPCNSPYDV